MTALPRKSLRLVRGIVALGILAALGAGTPLALTRIAGWPLPRSMPGWDSLSQPIPDAVFLKVVATVCWLAWAQLMACLLVEVIACLRGEATPRLPGARGSQRLAGWLVASFMALPLHSSVGATAATLPVPIRHTMAVPAPDVVADAVPPDTSRQPVRQATDVGDAAQRECVVGLRDTLWSISQRHLGDPRRWPEIFELNEGRPQRDGGSLTNPRHIRSGWTLRLPPSIASETVVTRPGNVVIMPGDSLSEVARRHLGDARRWPEIFELNRGVPQSDGRSLRDPDVIRPQWVLRLSVDHNAEEASAAPTTPQAVVLSQPGSASPTEEESGQAVAAAKMPEQPSPAAPSGSPAAEARVPTPPTTAKREPAPEDHKTGKNPVPPLALLGTGLTAVGVIVALDRLRRVRARRRLPGDIPSPPDATLVDQEIHIRAEASDHETDVDRLDVCLRAMAAALAREPDRPRPSIVAVQVAPDQIEFLLADACPSPPEGFAASDNGWTWSMSAADLDALRLHADRVAPLPALVSLGTSVGGTVLIDLEAAGVVALDGDPDEARRLLRQFVLELATSTWADHLDVVVAGDPPPGAKVLSRVRHVQSLMDVVDELEEGAAARRAALGDLPSTFAARTTGDGGDGWTPTIVICTQPPDDPTAERLAALVDKSGTGVGVVVPGPTPLARWTLRCENGTIETAPFGLRLHSTGLNEEHLDAVGELLATEAAPHDDGAEVTTPDGIGMPEPTPLVPDGIVTLPAVPAADEPDEEPIEEAPFEVEVRLIGPADVVGSGQPIEGGRPLELIAYLALHPEGADADRLRTVLWPPDRPAPAAKTFANVISLTRGLIGARHFPQATSEIYRVAETVTTDVARFEALVTKADHQAKKRAIETLRSALTLVRGRPFAATQGFHWIQAEGLPARIDALVVDSAHRMADLCLITGDPSAADWAARQGLLASPGNEILYRDRMLAADAAGNPSGVEAAMQELCDLLEADDATDRVHPDTLALYEELTSKWSKRATG